MCEAHANVDENAQPNASASNASSYPNSRQNITNDTKTTTLQPLGGRSTFLSKYVKRIKYLNSEYQICNVDRCYHI